MGNNSEYNEFQLQSSQESYTQTLRSACKIGTSLFKADYCGLLLRDSDNKSWILSAECPVVGTKNRQFLPFQDSPSLVNLQSIETVIQISDISKLPLKGISQLFEKDKFHTFSIIPVKSAGGLIGIILLGIIDNIVHAPHIIPIETYAIFGEHISSIIRNPEIYKSESIYRFPEKQAVVHSKNHEQILRMIIEYAVKLTGAKSGGIYKYDTKTG